MSKKLTFNFIIISLFLAVGMYLIHNQIFKDHVFIIKIRNIYFFFVLVNTLEYLSLYFVSKFSFDKTGFTFMTLSVLKMLISIIFLIPIFRSKNENLIPEIINFFIPYFVFLIMGIVFSLKLIQLSNK
jgi:hypothetical protein